MLVNRILLQDDTDRDFSDLIIFDNEVDIEEIKEIIWQVKTELSSDYTFDDIIGAIRKNFKIFAEIDLYSTNIIYY